MAGPRGGKRGGGGKYRGGRGGGNIGVRRNKSGLARSTNQAGTGERVNWNESVDVTKNPVFEAYYWDQGIVDPSEWDAFMGHLRTPLATSFRITSGKPSTKVLLQQMHDFYLPFLSNVIFEGEPIPPPKAMPWYPESMAWQIDVKKNALRKTEQFKKFQNFLVHETEVGNISRQESVSMIPPLFMNVEPHHIVLDMCAAPGSKTAQLIEALHSPLTSSADSYDPCPPGIVIANDSDAKRAHMLVHQSSRLPSPNIVVANCDASRWPSIKVPWLAKDGAKENIQQRTMKYDRILADVPCSGDGTLRKNLMIWKDWHPHNAASLHPLQIRILMRGLDNLRSGGRLVYSTCSLNPIEDEAVVAEALRLSKGTVRLVDSSKDFPELKRRKGVFTWKVLPTRGKQSLGKAKDDVQEQGEQGENGDASSSYRDTLPKLDYVSSWDELTDETMKEKLPKSLWPQGDEEELKLDRCMRVCPQDQNTGGFFVAVLEKVDGQDADLAEGMALGMIRAMAKRDQDADKEQQNAASANGKRSLSPSASGEASEEPQVKRAKVDGEVAAEAESSSSARKQAPANGDTDIGLPGGAPYREDPMVYVDKDNDQTKSIVSFFGLNDKFDARNLMVRNKEAVPLRSVYFTGTSVRALISSGGPGRGDHLYGNPLKLRLINCGIRAFARQDAGKDPQLKCRWRVTSDSLPVLRPLVDPSKVMKGSLEEFAFLMSNHYPKLSDLPSSGLFDVIKAVDLGSHLVDIEPGTWNGHTLERTLSVPIWRAPASVNLMLERQEKSALSYRTFESDLSNPSGDRQISKMRPQNAAQQTQKDKRAARLAAGSNMDEDALQELENAAATAANKALDEAAKTSQTIQKEEEALQLLEEGQALPVETADASTSAPDS